MGTTRFDTFISSSISQNFVNTVYKKGYRHIIMQIGKGDFTVPSYAQIYTNTTNNTDRISSSSSSPTTDTWSFFIPCTDTEDGRNTITTGSTIIKIGIEYTVYRLKPNIATDIDKASLVISHAGAGSIFESLRAQKPLIIVINTLLMDNHQTEIADALSLPRNGGPYLYYCEPANLVDTLATIDIYKLQPLPPKDMTLFVKEVNNVMGWYDKTKQ